MTNVIKAAEEFLRLVAPHEDWDSEHHRRTPLRFAKMLQELTNAETDEFELTTFASKSNEMVVVQDIPFVSLCAHHVLPFTGKAHIGYIPNGKIAGLSKFARCVKWMSRGLWVQEELTYELAEFLDTAIEPMGLAVVMVGRHSCMEIRGVQAVGSLTTTSAMRGVFLDETRGARQEFLGLLRNRSNIA